MSTFEAVNHYFSGQGVAMIGSRDPVTGLPAGLRPVGNVPDLKITVATTVVDHKGSQDGQRAIDARLQTETKCTVSITIENWIATNLAKALRGDNTPVAAGSVTAEAVNLYPGMVTAFQYINISTLVLMMGTITLTAYTTPGTPWDYKVNEAAGSVMINDGTEDGGYDGFVAPVSPAVSVAGSAAYSYSEQNLVDSLTQPLTENWIHFEGLNTLEENSPVVVDIFAFSNDPLKELALLGDTFGQFVLEGIALYDPLRETGSKYFQVRKLD